MLMWISMPAAGRCGCSDDQSYTLLAQNVDYDKTLSEEQQAAIAQLLQEQVSIYGTADSSSGGVQEAVVFPSVRMTLAPYIQGWTFTSNATVEPITEVFVPVNYHPACVDLNDAASREQSLINRTVLQYRITYQRSTFTKAFAVALVALMWVLSVCQFVLSSRLHHCGAQGPEA